VQPFQNRKVRQKAHTLNLALFRMTAELPRDMRFEMSSQIRRAGISICSNIAERCGRRGDREFRRFLDMAFGSACELENLLILATDLSLLNRDPSENLLVRGCEIKRMLSGLTRTLTAES